MVLAPESDYVAEVTTANQAQAVEEYLQATKRRTERDRMADRRVSGVFSGSYAENPLTGEAIPIWISDYVLAGYGTGAIMAVPGHDSRDFAFARHFDLPIIQVVLPEGEEVSDTSSWTESKDSKSGTLVHSGFLDGLSVQEAIAKMKVYITEHQLGRVRTNYRLRDAIFSRQRYWGEPFPIVYDETGLPIALPEEMLPIELPEVTDYSPKALDPEDRNSDPVPPLARATDWTNVELDLGDGKKVYRRELNVMPQWAGSCWYEMRYIDPTDGVIPGMTIGVSDREFTQS